MKAFLSSGRLFIDAHLKIERANKHIADLKTAMLALEDTYTSTVERDTKTGYQKLVHTFPKADTALLGLSVIAGDAIHNLHSALDFAYVSAVKKLIPSAVGNYTKFPVYPTKDQLEGVLKGRKIDKLGPNLFTTIVSDIQPYRGGQAGLRSAQCPTEEESRSLVAGQVLFLRATHHAGAG